MAKAPKKAAGDAATADTVAAGAIEGARAAEQNGGDADDVTAAAIGGAAAAATQATGENVVADGVEQVPAAPGDDPESVSERRAAILMQLAEEAEFETGTAFGDLREVMLDLFKHRPKPWAAMVADEKQDMVRAIEAAAKRVLQKLVLLLAQQESTTIEATFLPGFAVKGEAIEAKLKIDQVDGDLLLAAYGLAGHRVVVISADDKRFMSARRAPEIQADQLAMGFGDDVREPPAAPSDDSDLAGDDQWGVFDTSRKEWLIDEEGGDDGWTTDKAQAGRFDHDRAKELAGEFAGDDPDTVVARQISDA